MDNISEIEELRSLNVWSQHQDILEHQALQELEIFAEQNCSTKQVVKDVVTTESLPEAAVTSKKVGDTTLNLEEYIKRQEELKKRLEYKRSLYISGDQQNAAVKRAKRKDDNVARCETTQSHGTKRQKSNTIRNEDKSGSEYLPSESDVPEYKSDTDETAAVNQQSRTKEKPLTTRVVDDGCTKLYKRRLKKYYKELESRQNCEVLFEEVNIGGLRVPAQIWNKLYKYQQDGVEWLWKIHQQKSGGLLGDEMGLGKTVEVITFLAALERSKTVSSYMGLGPTLIVAPATVVHQWVKHFHEWAPEFRVAILHHSGSFAGGNRTHLIREINKCKGILLSTYSGILRYKGCLADFQWQYLILDEGHKIRNANAKVTVAIKQIRTPHRLMLTGSPMQNNLQELWSLFDFIEPGMLGTLPTFMEHFNAPIIQGGYTNATPMQEATALSVATALKDLISPHLLRRTKDEVKEDIRLPNKSEQVLFCSLTEEQHELYKRYLMSEHVSMILGRGEKQWFSHKQTRANVFVAITTLRKICNHPDLHLNDEATETSFFRNLLKDLPKDGSNSCYYRRSGKMIVVSALLKIWKKQKHRVLLFTQARSMISAFEAFLMEYNYSYLKMDGSTSVSARQPLINKFNNDPSYDVFLSTTRVGGLGVNLIGANRVIIYDPDWNPATDTQARERAWRIGQEKPVTVYRLVSAGTIEEKMYQRQVWKQLLTNKVLIDPRTQKFFKTSDLHDLFSLPDQINESTLETANIFKNSRVNIQEKIDKKKKRKDSEVSAIFSDEKLQAMKNLAQQIAKSILPNSGEKQSSYQKELSDERLARLHQKESLKTLTPIDLRALNRKKTERQIEDPVNKIDDSETSVTFSTALNLSGRTARLYNTLKSNKVKSNNDDAANTAKIDGTGKYLVEEVKIQDSTHTVKKKRKRDKKEVLVDHSQVVDGETVEGLMKAEVKKKKKVKNKSSVVDANQDQYVLEKLFSKKGVHSALQHDVIVQSGYKDNNIKIHYEAQQRTDLALQALKKSRLEAWRW